MTISITLQAKTRHTLYLAATALFQSIHFKGVYTRVYPNTGYSSPTVCLEIEGINDNRKLAVLINQLKMMKGVTIEEVVASSAYGVFSPAQLQELHNCKTTRIDEVNVLSAVQIVKRGLDSTLKAAGLLEEESDLLHCVLSVNPIKPHQSRSDAIAEAVSIELRLSRDSDGTNVDAHAKVNAKIRAWSALESTHRAHLPMEVGMGFLHVSDITKLVTDAVIVYGHRLVTFHMNGRYVNAVINLKTTQENGMAPAIQSLCEAMERTHATSVEEALSKIIGTNP